jgi:hypothetical protein
LKKALVLLLCIALSACSSGTGLLEKPGPAPVGGDSLVTPPWQTQVRAGAGAANDIDYETLDGVPQLPTTQPGGVAAPGMPDPKPPVTDGTNEPTKPAADTATKGKSTEISAVAVVPVTGGSAQGSKDLTQAMRHVLSKAGWPVVDAPAPNALTIKGDIKLDAAEGPNQAVHINWAVTSPAGKTIGTVSQNNDVPAHTLDNAWGQTADMAAQAAADGIFKLIEKYR